MSRSISWCVAGSYGNGDRRPMGLCVSGRTLLLNYTIQPVVKPDWQPVVSCIQTFNRTGSAGCQTGYTTWFDNRWNEQRLFVQHWLFVQPVVKPGLRTVLNEQSIPSTRLSNRFYIPLWQPAVYTIQPIVKRVWQPVVSFTRGIMHAVKQFRCCC